MGKLLLVFTILNVIVLTSCTETKVQKVTATATSDSDGKKSSATASAKITTTKVSNTNNSSEQGSTDISMNSNCSGALERVNEKIVKFTYQFLKELIYSKNNTMIGSPLSTYFLVCQFVLYAEGKTKQQIMKFCGLKTAEEARCAYPIILSYNENMPYGTKFYYSRNVVSDLNNIFTAPRRRNLKYIIDANGINGDFQKPTVVTRFVNKVIAKGTNNKVRNTITSSNIFKENPKSSKLVLATGEYFESLFEYAFNTSNITMRNYYDMDNRIYKVPFVTQYGMFNYTYSSVLKAQILSIPFVDGFFNCVIIVPEKKCSSNLIELVNKIIINPGLVKEALCNLTEEGIVYNAPYYANIELTTNPVDILKKVGNIDSFFNPRTAQIENGYGKPINVYLSDGRQKTVLRNDIGGKYPPPSMDEVLEKCKKVYSVVADHASIFMIENNGVPRIISIGKPRFDEE